MNGAGSNNDNETVILLSQNAGGFLTCLTDSSFWLFALQYKGNTSVSQSYFLDLMYTRCLYSRLETLLEWRKGLKGHCSQWLEDLPWIQTCCVIKLRGAIGALFNLLAVLQFFQQSHTDSFSQNVLLTNIQILCYITISEDLWAKHGYKAKVET